MVGELRENNGGLCSAWWHGFFLYPCRNGVPQEVRGNALLGVPPPPIFLSADSPANPTRGLLRLQSCTKDFCNKNPTTVIVKRLQMWLWAAELEVVVDVGLLLDYKNISQHTTNSLCLWGFINCYRGISHSSSQCCLGGEIPQCEKPI